MSDTIFESKKWRTSAWFWVGLLSIGFYFLSTFFVYRHIGISWDEGLDRITGLVNVKFILTQFFPNASMLAEGGSLASIPLLDEWQDRYYGSWFLILSAIVRFITRYDSFFPGFLVSHLLLAWIVGLGFISLFHTMLMLSQKPWVATMTMLFAMTMPRFFIEGFYNAKDILLLTMMMIGVWAIVQYHHRPRFGTALILGLVLGIAMATRLTGGLLLALFILLQVFRVLRERTQRRKIVQHTFVALIPAGIVMVLLMPALWSNPFLHTIRAFRWMSWLWTDWQMFLDGNVFHSGRVPWWYTMRWMMVTLPEPVLAIVILGLFLLPFLLWKSRNSDGGKERLVAWLLGLGLFALPLFLVQILHVRTYDGWRHLYFVMAGAYVIMGLLFTEIGRLISNHPRKNGLRVFGSTILIAAVLWNIRAIVILFPYSNTYFNALASRPLVQHYDVDYWGLTYREGVEWILRNDPRERIGVSYPGGIEHAAFHDPALGDRTVFVEKKDADYLLTTYRMDFEPYPFPEVYRIVRDGQVLMSIYRVR